MIRVGEQLSDGLTRDVRSLRWSVMVKCPRPPQKLKKISLAKNTGNGLKCILRQTYFFSIFFLGGVGGHFAMTDHLTLLTSLVRPSDNCLPTRIIQNPFHDM